MALLFCHKFIESEETQNRNLDFIEDGVSHNFCNPEDT
jgi:hypothetical protein